MANSAVVLTDKTKLAQGAFRVELTANQSIVDNVDTKIQFDDVIYDGEGWFDAVTNFRYTPQIAGKYAISCTTSYDTTVNGESQRSIILKNGTTIIGTDGDTSDVFAHLSQCAYTEIEMNGTTDFIEFFTRQNNIANTAEDLLIGDPSAIPHAIGHLIGL